MKKETKEFLDQLHGSVKYWVGIAEEEKPSYEDFANSIIFSVLADIDGCGMSNAILMFNTDDDGDIAECINDQDKLHENWYKK